MYVPLNGEYLAQIVFFFAVHNAPVVVGAFVVGVAFVVGTFAATRDVLGVL